MNLILMAITGLTTMLARQRSISKSTTVASNIFFNGSQLTLRENVVHRGMLTVWCAERDEEQLSKQFCQQGKCQHSTFSLLW